MEYAQPKEGSVVLMVAECVIANNSEPELAQKLAAYLLSPEAQSKALQYGNIVPSNTKAKAATPEAEAKLKKFHELHEDCRHAGLGCDQREAARMEQPLEQDDRTLISS